MHTYHSCFCLTACWKYTNIRIMQPSEWTIEFYLEENGRAPVAAFLESLDLKAKSRMLAAIEQLRVRNVSAGEPLVRHLEGKLWELRRESNTNIYRLVYFFFTGRRIVLLHGFQKKTQKTPRHEIELALQRMEIFLTLEGGEY